MEILFVAIVIVIVIAGIEWATRSAPSPIRWGLLVLCAVIALWWLATQVLGVM